MTKWIIKKFILRQLNKLLDKYGCDITSLKNILIVWITRLESIITCFKSLLKKLDDGKIDDKEIDEAVDEVRFTVKNW